MTRKAYKYRLYPNRAQTILLDRTAGSCRYVFNRALALRKRYYELTGKGISFYRMCKQLAKWKTHPKTSWLQDVNSQALQSSLRNLDKAYVNFFKKLSDFPRFKSKFDRQSFQNPQKVHVDFNQNRVVLPKLQEGVKAKFSRQFQGKIKTATVSRTPAGKYYVSVLVEESGQYPTPAIPTPERTLGIDLGLTTFATTSEGVKYIHPKPLKKHLTRLQHAQRVLSRRSKGSARRARAKLRVGRLYERISDIRSDFLHKLSRRLVENQDHDGFALEDLNVGGMMANHCLARAIGEAGWREFRRQMEYKAKEVGKTVLVINRFEPSSKRCPCGVINRELSLSDRTWTCVCGLTHDRDLLAAQNIRHFAFNPTCTAGPAGIYSRGVPTGGRRTVNVLEVSLG